MHQDIVVPFVVLIGLGAAIIVLGVDLLLRPPHKTRSSHTLPSDFEIILDDEATDKPDTITQDIPERQFVFRRHLAQEQPIPDEESEPEETLPPPASLDFNTIQNEIRAALGAPAPQHKALNHVQLNWAESGRLAVLSLGQTAPDAAWPVLREQGVHILIIPEGHPFATPNRDLELIHLQDLQEADLPALTAKLRSKLSKGERIAFYTEAGLSGAAALLAARLSSRAPG